MISNIFNKNPNNSNIFKKLILPLVVFIIGFLSFFSYVYSNPALDSIILITACFNPLYPFVILFGQCIGILFTSIYFNYLPEFVQLSFTFITLTNIILFSMLRLFVYSFFFKKILEKFDIRQIVNIFIVFGIFNVFLSFFYFIFITLFNNMPSIVQLLPLGQKIEFYVKSLPYLLKQFNNININNLNDLFKYSNIGINSMFLNIRLFMSSYIASIFLSIILKDPTNEMFQKFDRSSLTVSKFYKILCLSSFLISVLLFIFKYSFLGLIVFSIFISFFFIFYIIGRNRLIDSLLEKTGNFMLAIIIFMLLMQFISYFIIILIIIGFIISVFNI